MQFCSCIVDIVILGDNCTEWNIIAFLFSNPDRKNLSHFFPPFRSQCVTTVCCVTHKTMRLKVSLELQRNYKKQREDFFRVIFQEDKTFWNSSIATHAPAGELHRIFLSSSSVFNCIARSAQCTLHIEHSIPCYCYLSNLSVLFFAMQCTQNNQMAKIHRKYPKIKWICLKCIAFWCKTIKVFTSKCPNMCS